MWVHELRGRAYSSMLQIPPNDLVSTGNAGTHRDKRQHGGQTSGPARGACTTPLGNATKVNVFDKPKEKADMHDVTPNRYMLSMHQIKCRPKSREYQRQRFLACAANDVGTKWTPGGKRGHDCTPPNTSGPPPAARGKTIITPTTQLFARPALPTLLSQTNLAPAILICSDNVLILSENMY